MTSHKLTDIATESGYISVVECIVD